MWIDYYYPYRLFAQQDTNKAYKENDKAVLAAYGLPKKATDSENVAFLFKKYAELTGEKQ